MRIRAIDPPVSAVPFAESFLALSLLATTSLSCYGDEKNEPLASDAPDGDVIINEIMYHPPLDLEELQYVELFNRGAAEADLSGWSFTRGIRLAFPRGTRMPAGGFLVVCRDLRQFSSRYGNDVPAVGNFEGTLSHRRDQLTLCDASGRAADSVRYSDRGDWPVGPDGYSPSLERISPAAESQRPENWAPSKLPALRGIAGTPGRRNDSHSANLPPAISAVEQWPRCPLPGQDVAISAEIGDDDGVKSAVLVYTVATPGRETREVRVPMQRAWGDGRKGTFKALIPGQPDRHLVRFRFEAVDSSGAARFQPSENEPCPTHSYFVYANKERAGVPLGFIIHVGGARVSPRRRSRWLGFPSGRSSAEREPTRGDNAFIYVPAGGNEYYTFDHVRIPRRQGGFKVRFHKARAFKGMSVINLIFEYQPRFVLAEPLAYELYRMAGVPAELTEHVRLWVDDNLVGYHLLIEQPNKAFLRRNGRDTTGNLYKLLWYGSGLIGKHEKKTNTTTGHDDLLRAVEGLNRTRGKEQWEFIQQHFHVEEFVNYFAVNMCISNWDGFFNNYFVYHDTGGTGKWEIYPWDEDKTWGDYDGASPLYDFYDMPLTFGMNGASSARRRGFGGPFGGGASWWRPPGYFSGPLLANSYFRRRFIARLGEVTKTLFTREKFFPVIEAMEKRLEPEVRIRAEAHGEDADSAVRTFKRHMESFRQQVIHRRRFILSQPELSE